MTCGSVHGCRKDGKTVCKDTFAGYVCTCGSGFISHIDPKNKTEVSSPSLRMTERWVGEY
jgi:hypothetical protein